MQKRFVSLRLISGTHHDGSRKVSALLVHGGPRLRATLAVLEPLCRVWCAIKGRSTLPRFDELTGPTLRRAQHEVDGIFLQKPFVLFFFFLGGV